MPTKSSREKVREMEERAPLLTTVEDLQDGRGHRNDSRNGLTEKDTSVNASTYITIDESYFLGSDVCYLDDGDGDPLMCIGYRKSWTRTVLFYFIVLITCGILYLVSHWKPLWRVYCTCARSPLGKSTVVILKDGEGGEWVEVVTTVEDADFSALCQNALVYCPQALFGEEEDNQTQAAQGDVVRKRVTDQRSVVSTHLHDSERQQSDAHDGRGICKYFMHKEYRYIYNHLSKKFELLKGYESKATLLQMHNCSRGLSRKDELSRIAVYGKNFIDVHVKSYLRLIIEESADPFYVFQVFSCILWFNDKYYYYASAILLISLVSICISTYQTKHHLQTLRNTIAKTDPVYVLRPSGREELISSDQLAVGDVIVIPPDGLHMHCDALLITGTAIVNESSLTGESVPVTKVSIQPVSDKNRNALDSEILDSHKHKKSILFCGTNVLQTRYHGDAKVLAVVFSTGFSTLKGNLVRSILHPKQMDFKFFKDALKFVGVLGIFALAGLAYSAYVFYRDGAGAKEITVRALDIITIAVPPALPAAMSVGVVYALQRLQRKEIFCISPSRINVAGKVKLFCFDKTGTLTEEGLDFYGVTKVSESKFEPLCSNISYQPVDDFMKGIASCHSLTRLHGQLCGNPLDLKIFEATQWEFEEVGKETELYDTIAPTIVRPRWLPDGYGIETFHGNATDFEIAILKQYPFSSDVQRMSVLVRVLGQGHMDIYTKGSPEVIASLCKRDTLPRDFEDHLSSFTRKGYRVIALASKSLSPNILWHQAQHMTRMEIESDLSFLGLIIMKNTLKSVTTSVIRELQEADIRVVMVTGDNLLTATSVARECEMVDPSHKILLVNLIEETHGGLGRVNLVPLSIAGEYLDEASIHKESSWERDYHFAMTGKTFATIRNRPDYERFLLCTTIYARMLPDQKALLVEDLQKLGYGVGMCGDGANDCGALKAAHCGISLSETEASVSSPFTSKVADISCVVKVIQEGRCALVTSFSVFKYMALYSMVQYMSVLLLYYIQSNLGNFQYLYIDLILILPIAITMSRTGPWDTLVRQRPLGSLIHPIVLISLISQILMQFAFQLGAWYFVRSLPLYKDASWFRLHRTKPDHAKTQVVCFENTALFCLTSFQYLALSVAFATGKPFRKPVYTNRAMLFVAAVLLSVTVVFTFFTGRLLPSVLQMVHIKDETFFITILELAGLNALLSISFEVFVVRSRWLKRVVSKLKHKKEHKNLYKKVKIDMDKDSNWPPSYT